MGTAVDLNLIRQLACDKRFSRMLADPLYTREKVEAEIERIVERAADIASAIEVPPSIADVTSAEDLAVPRAHRERDQAQALQVLARNDCRCWRAGCAKCSKFIADEKNRGLLEIVLAAYDAGMVPIPVLDKSPLVKYADWYYPGFRPEREEVESRFAMALARNRDPLGYALLMGPCSPYRLICLDCDTPEAYAALEEEWPNYPWREISNSKSRKGHYFFRCPDGVNPFDMPAQITEGISLHLPSGRIAAGADVKAARSYVISHGSWHAKAGDRYRAPMWPWWDHPILDLPIDNLKLERPSDAVDKKGAVKARFAPIAFRAWIDGEVEGRARTKADVKAVKEGTLRPSVEYTRNNDSANYRSALSRARAYVSCVPGATGGKRHRTCYWLACKLLYYYALDRGPGDALDLLLRWAPTCSPALPEWDVHDAFKKAQKYGVSGLSRAGYRYGDWEKWTGEEKPEATAFNPVTGAVVVASDQAYCPTCEPGSEPDFLAELSDAPPLGVEAGEDEVEVEAPAPGGEAPKPPSAAIRPPEKKKREYEWEKVSGIAVRYANRYLHRDDTRLTLEREYTILSEGGEGGDDMVKLWRRCQKSRSNLKKLFGCETGSWDHRGRKCPEEHEAEKRRYFCRLNGLCRFCSENEAKLARAWCDEKWNLGLVTVFEYVFSDDVAARRDEIKQARRELVGFLKHCRNLPWRWIESHRRVVVIGHPDLYAKVGDAFADNSERESLLGHLLKIHSGRVHFMQVDKKRAMDIYFDCFVEPAVKLWHEQKKLEELVDKKRFEGPGGAQARAQGIIDFPLVSMYHEQRHSANKPGKSVFPYPDPKKIGQLGREAAIAERPELASVEPGHCCRLIDGKPCNKKLSPGHAAYRGKPVVEFEEMERESGYQKALCSAVLSGQHVMGRYKTSDPGPILKAMPKATVIKRETIVTFQPREALAYHPRL